jgi:hypothetical protein
MPCLEAVLSPDGSTLFGVTAPHACLQQYGQSGQHCGRAPSLPRKLTSLGAAASDIATRRQTDPVSLRRLVDGDLNLIAMKALEKARERRYASVSDLAADIQRYLEDRPVLASSPGRRTERASFSGGIGWRPSAPPRESYFWR